MGPDLLTSCVFLSGEINCKRLPLFTQVEVLNFSLKDIFFRLESTIFPVIHKRFMIGKGHISCHHTRIEPNVIDRSTDKFILWQSSEPSARRCLSFLTMDLI